jgi:signal transduction histidine kinase
VTVVLAYLDDTVSLNIHDDGVGFEDSVAVARPDSGFGLLGMRERAEQLGGSVAVESQPGRGTTIGIRLPVPAT